MATISEKLDIVIENQAKQGERLDNFAKDQKEHHVTLYGNGKDGAVKDITLLQERQEACPARVANSVENIRLKVSHVMIIIAIISLLASIALGVMNLSN